MFTKSYECNVGTMKILCYIYQTEQFASHFGPAFQFTTVSVNVRKIHLYFALEIVTPKSEMDFSILL